MRKKKKTYGWVLGCVSGSGDHTINHFEESSEDVETELKEKFM